MEDTGPQVSLLLRGAARKEAQLPQGTMLFLAAQYLPMLERMDVAQGFIDACKLDQDALVRGSLPT